MSAFTKGGTFQNRYLFKFTLRATAPFHLGSGQIVTRPSLKDKDSKLLDIGAVSTDANGKACITGSSLRGALRGWLGLCYDKSQDALGKKIDGAIKDNKISDPDDLIQFICDNASTLELLFGTQHNEGKVEVWDAGCTSKITDDTMANAHYTGWDKDRCTYVAKSVAIDPATGTAEDGKLYNFELVPTGATFAATISAQNLSEEEAALILMVLTKGFSRLGNPPATPIVLGAMGKLGFGVFDISDITIYRLKKERLSDWKTFAEKSNAAGYDSIAIEEFKLVGQDLKTLEAIVPNENKHAKHVETLRLTLATPMVIRSGGAIQAREKNTAVSKTRNYQMEFNWGKPPAPADDHEQIADLYHSLKIEGEKIVPYYHIPSSSLRGAIRSWAIKRLLPENEWNIESCLNTGQHPTPNSNCDNLLSLFGFAVNAPNPQITKEYTKAGRLTIRVDQFDENVSSPTVDGTWRDRDNQYGPNNAARHVKPRNPLDRVTHEAKHGGLHNALEFSAGQTFTATIEIDQPQEFDMHLLARLKEDITNGIFRIGGLSSIGRGRLELSDLKEN